MIKPISDLKTLREPFPIINGVLIQAGDIQIQRIECRTQESLPDKALLWSPTTAGPHLVRVIRWIE